MENERKHSFIRNGNKRRWNEKCGIERGEKRIWADGSCTIPFSYDSTVLLVKDNGCLPTLVPYQKLGGDP